MTHLVTAAAFIGEWTEALFLAHALRHGFKLARPWGNMGPVDWYIVGLPQTSPQTNPKSQFPNPKLLCHPERRPPRRPESSDPSTSSGQALQFGPAHAAPALHLPNSSNGAGRVFNPAILQSRNPAILPQSRNPAIVRVQVRATSTPNGDGYCCGLRTHHKDRRPHSPNDIDFLAAYVIPEEAWYFVPSSILAPLKSGITLSPRGKYSPFRENWDLLNSMVLC